MPAPTKERTRFGPLPEPERADLFWGLRQDELAKITDGQLTALLIATPEFHELIGPMLDAVDERNRTIGNKKNMGRPSRFTSLQLESVLLYRRIAGLSTIKETRERLFFDREAQELLDLTKGLPSLKTMSRYMIERLDVDQRAGAYRELDRRLRRRVMEEVGGIDSECRILGMDGSRQGTRYTAPIPEIVNKENTGKIVNEESVTAPTAGFVGGHNPKSGRGWQLVALWSHHGTLLAWDISPLNESETHAAERLLASYEQEVRPFRGKDTISVLTADGGFNSNKLRKQAQDLFIVPNIHKASHKTIPSMPEDESESSEKLNEKWLPIKHPSQPHYANWELNGHAELRCQCGNQTKRVHEAGKGLSMAVKGCCASCGNVTITAGQWRLATDGRSYVRCKKGDTPDYAIGNSLTFNDPIAKAYGEDRFGWNESIHSTLKSRFGLLCDDSRMRDITEVKTEFAITGSAISVLLLERQARSSQPIAPVAPSAAKALPPIGHAQPPLPLAA